MPNMQLAKNLRTLRMIHGLTQTDLSALLNISRQAYSNYENSKRTPDLDSLVRITQIYRVTLDELVNQNVGQVIAENEGPYYPALSIQSTDTLYLTQEETQLIMKFRDISEDNRKILLGFLSSQTYTVNHKYQP